MWVILPQRCSCCCFGFLEACPAILCLPNCSCCRSQSFLVSQVCSLVWSKHEKEILSSHGFTQNQLTLWKYPSMVKVADLTGHQSRVLHMAVSPDGNTVVSGAADETLRFWKVFGSDGAKLDKSKTSFANAQLSRASSIR